jgi:Arc/MetJ family transcription regulator
MKTSIDIDRAVANRAAEILGTKTLKDTVDAALREVVSAELRRQLAEEILAGTLPVPTVEELAAWRAPQVPLGALDNERDPAA